MSVSACVLLYPQRVATLEVENDQLQFLKTIRHFDADKPQTAETPSEVEEASNSTLDDLGFPDDDPSTEGKTCPDIVSYMVTHLCCSVQFKY